MTQERDGGGGGGAVVNIPDASVTTPVYGDATANSQDVIRPYPGWQFPASEAGPAAAGLIDLKNYIAGARSALQTARTNAATDWLGPHHDTFETKCSNFVQSCENIEAALETLANGLADAWAAAVGQQRRICGARGFAHEQANESFFGKVEDAWGEEEYHPPGDPGVPDPGSDWSLPGDLHKDGCGH
jgi:hypothetical protein